MEIAAPFPDVFFSTPHYDGYPYVLVRLDAIDLAEHEEGDPAHRLRVEHDNATLLIHLSDEDGPGWTVFAVDREEATWGA